MLNFDFYAPTRVLFGKGEQDKVGALLKPRAKKVLLHYGGGSIKKSGLYDAVTASLRRAGLEYVELGGVAPNPRLALVREGIALCKKEGVDLVLAVGGGSAIDSGKAIAMGARYDGDVWDMYETQRPIESALPVAVILTIPAAGSEGSGDSVVTNEETGRKLGYGSPHLRPLLSIVNPALFMTLPKEQIANGVADMMSHVFERYFTNTAHTDLTDGLCETVLRTIIKSAPIVYADPSNYDAWCEVGFAGTVAHNGLVGMGRQQDWACHGMEHELSALYDVAHGAGLAVLTPSWMEYVYKTNIDMFVQFAVNVMGVRGSYREPEALVREGIARLRAFFTGLGLPGTLTGLGIDDGKLEWMAKRATCAAFGAEQPLGGLQKLYWQDVWAIYQRAL
ncbi:MAG: iron-containing alcohol dehydrogenase [Christensenellaceae bacterium]|jgi:alcohol dehydrogenase YqhD (iron-dependent ADH family)|nr:iron-containing alcohol dehydrogenase [Christensenellaceae bacterium]